MESGSTDFSPPEDHIRSSHMHHSHVQHHEMIPSSSLLIILVPIIIVVLLIAILLLALMLRRLQFSRPNNVASTKTMIDNTNCMFIAHRTISLNPSSDSGGCLYGSSLGGKQQAKVQVQIPVQVFTFKEVEIATNKFSESNIIESGASGVVYRGILRDGTAAAFKALRANGRSGERAFRSEVDLLSRLRCPQISELLGYCADQHHRLLVFEYMPNGSLEKHLHPRNSQCRVLNWVTRLKIALDCARALEYLHEHMTPSIIHRNFKCSNILLDQNLRAKLSGFGLAKIGSDKLNGLISTRVLGTTGYLAPEYASTGKLTTKSDVYSYGVILLELLTGRVPIDTARPSGEHVLVSWALPHLTNREKVIEMIDPALKGQFSNKDLIQVAAIAAMCVQAEADYRPLMTDVVQSLMPLIKNHSQTCLSKPLRYPHTPSPRT